MKPEDLENIIENNGVYILTKEQMQGILAQMNKEPEPIHTVVQLLLSNIKEVSTYEDFREDGLMCNVKIGTFPVTPSLARSLAYLGGVLND